jgi:metal-responsive CopG/Arc/MetJ family transcriptional regulator
MALPALNGFHHTDAIEDESETERIWATLPRSMVAAIDDYHYGKRLKTRSVAVRELLQLGLNSTAAWPTKRVNS